MSDFKQAVIDILTRYRDSWQGDYYVPFRKAIDEISALSEKMQLSQEDTTKDTTSDLISRLDVLQLIRTLPPEEGMTKGLLETSVKQLPSAQPTLRKKALLLLLEWAVECGFGYDNIPEEYATYEKDVENMGYTEGLIYIAEREVEQNE